MTATRVKVTLPPRSLTNASTSSFMVTNMWPPDGSWSPTWRTSNGLSLFETSTAKPCLNVRLARRDDPDAGRERGRRRADPGRDPDRLHAASIQAQNSMQQLARVALADSFLDRAGEQVTVPLSRKRGVIGLGPGFKLMGGLR